MGNLFDIQNQIEKLQKQASDIRTREFDKTVQEIVEKMQVFGITVKNLQVAKVRSAKPGGLARKKKGAGAVVKSSKRAGTKVAPKYRGPAGETWSGRGLMPRWLNTLVEQGTKKEDFAIKP
jgi:DNA-binding protein H-NS